MEIRFHVDRATGNLHIHSHNVSEDEVEDVLTKPLEDLDLGPKARLALRRRLRKKR